MRYLVLLLLAACVQSVQVQYSDIPKLIPLNTTVTARSQYTLSTFLPLALTATSSFLIDFQYSKIVAPSGNLNCSYLNQTTQSYTTFTGCSCSNSVCTLTPGAAFPVNYNLLLQFGLLTNPNNVNDQIIAITVNISSTKYALVNSTISQLVYNTLTLSVSGFQQSDYSVGTTNVSYSFNFSVGAYLPQNAMLQIIVPQEVGLQFSSYTCNFYGVHQTSNPTYLTSGSQKSLIFYFTNTELINSTLNSTLTIVGFVNPQFIGSSSTFFMIVKDIKDFSCPTGCMVSQLTAQVLASSTTSGDLPVSSLFADNTLVNQPCTVTLNLQLFAPIPVGGRLSIMLPAGIAPSLPVKCTNVNGYSLTDSNGPTCTYDTTTNNISTVNFAYPFLASTSTAVMSFSIVNPPDTSNYLFGFQTLDSNGRIIGLSRKGYLYSCEAGSLAITAQRNDTTVDAYLKLSFNATFANPVPVGGRLQILIPSEMANVTSAPTCLTTGAISLNCIGSWVAGSTPPVYNLSFVPVCYQGCITNNSIAFTVTGLRNPSYINPSANSVTVQSVSQNFNGIVDTIDVALSQLSLTAANASVANVTVSGSNVVGDEQTLRATFAISSYFQYNDGTITLSLPPNSTFVFSTPQAYVVSGTATVPITTTFTSYDQNMMAISTITLSGACSKTVCSSQLSLMIKGISYSYSAMSYSPYNFSIATNSGAPISNGGIPYPTTSPTPKQSTLTAASTSQVTGALSNYNFSFVPTIPVDSSANGGQLVITLPTNIDLSKSGGCSVITNVSLGFSLSCQLSGRTAAIGYATGSPQSLKGILITMVVANIGNPQSSIPLNYSISSYFNGALSETFSGTLQMTSLAQGTATYSKTNNTYNTSSNITIVPTWQFAVSTTDSISLYIPVGLFSFTGSTVSLINQSSNQAVTSAAVVVSNSTFTTITFTPLWSVTSFGIGMQIANPATTQQLQSIQIYTVRSGYQSQKANLTLSPCDAMVLAGSLLSSDRVTGDLTNLTLSFSKNANSITAVITLPNGPWDYSQALLPNGSALVNGSTITLSASPNTILLKNLINKPDTSPTNGTMQLTCLDSASSAVEILAIATDGYLANTAKAINASGVRSVADSSVATNLTVNITNYNYQTNKTKMQFDLPSLQFWLSSTMTCSFVLPVNASNNLQQPCQVTQVNGYSVTTNHPCSTSKCANSSFGVTLVGLGNLYSDSSAVNLTVLSNGYPSEVSSFVVTPSITTPSLNNASVVLSSNIIATSGTLSLVFSSPLPIQPTSTISLSVDDLVFLPNGDCSYSIGATYYSGCAFSQSANGYLLQAKLKSLGIATIAANTTFQIQLPVTNSYAAYNISAAKVSIAADAPSFSIGRFTTTMRVVLNADTFTPTTLNNLVLSRNSTVCGQPVSFLLSLAIPVNFYMSSIINLMIPKDEVSTAASNALTAVNGTLQYTSEDGLYYFYSLKQSVCLSTSCYAQQLSFNLSGFINNLYPKYSPNSFMVGLTFNNTLVAPTKTAVVQGLQALQANITANRTVTEPLKATNISLVIGIGTPINTSTTIAISTGLNILYGAVTGAWLVGSSNTAISYASTPSNGNSSYISNLSLVVPQLGATSTLLFQVVNSPLVPLAGSKLSISIYNSSMIFYSNTQVPIAQEIVAYQQNVTMTRSVSTVASPFVLYISGSFGLVNLAGYSIVVNTTEGTCGGCVAYSNGSTLVPISSNPFNISMTGFTNPLDTVDSVFQCQIVSSTYMAYSNQVLVQPTPIPIQFTSQLALSTLIVNRLANLTVVLNSVSGTDANITLPGQLMSRLNGCYFNNNKLTVCTSSYDSTNNFYAINAKGLSLSSATSNQLLVEVQLYPAVQSISNTINVSVRAPIAISTTQLTATLVADVLSLAVTSSSNRVNVSSNITVNIVLLAVSGTYTDVTLPFVVGVVTVPGCTFQLHNTTTVRITSFSSASLVLSFSNVTNPYDNRLMVVAASQYNNATGTLVASGSSSYQMSQLGTITVLSAIRNSSNLNAPITITLQLSFDTAGSMLLVRLLQSQVYFINGLSCRVDGTSRSCVNLNNQVNISGQWSGTRVITITGFSNSKSSQKLTASDTMVFQLFNTEGYQVASSTVQSYLIPEEITGNITVANYAATSQTIFTPVVINFKFGLQNPLTTNSALVLQQNTSYVAMNNQPISCSINGRAESCVAQGNLTTVTISDVSLSNGTLSINGYYVGIQPGLIRIRSVDVEHTADIDSTQLTNPVSSYTAFPLTFRVILASNTIGSHDFLIVVDTVMPKFQDRIYKLQLAIQSTNTSASSLGVDANSVSQFATAVVLPSTQFEKLSLSGVNFLQKGDVAFNMSVVTDDNIQVAVGSTTKSILSQESNNCNSVDCSTCATSVTGAEMCLQCRDAKLSYQGGCLDKCPAGSFNYSGTCQKCSGMCGNCFGATSTECLSCNPPLIDNSGMCTDASNCTGLVQNGYCVSPNPCQEGCKSCSPSQFCYECVENYAGVGVCVRVKNVPDTFYTYFVAPPTILWLVLVAITAIKCHGLTSFLGVSIFSLALVQLFCNGMMVPLADTLPLSIIVSGLLVIRVVVSVASYQGYFKSFVYKDDQLIVKELTHKDKIIGFFAHLICVDSYMLYLSKIGSPSHERSMPFARGVKVFNIVNMLVRLALMVVAGYFLSTQRLGDYVLLPLVCLGSQLLLGLFHVLANNYLFQKLSSCLSKIRTAN